MVNHPGHPLPYDDYRAAIERETDRFAATVEGADPATLVPSCPGWTLADLTRHVGAVQRWFSVLLTRNVQEPPRGREIELGLPERADQFAEWLRAGLPETAAVLRTIDPDAPMWAWGADQHARFWARRMLFETLVHRVDAEHAVGRTPDIDPALAADGVDEFLVNLPYAEFFAPDVANLRGNGEALAFQCTDPGPGSGEWLVRLRPDTFGVESFDAEPPTGQRTVPGQERARVRGRAADMLLLMYGRLRYDDAAFEATGDEETLTRWSTHSKF
ncbi:maleylpyruvate isomerase family mycothiol-dependent enzyme [Streptantibioticus ferralitis]|uniref:Maleylpyruvate isomerase family mycothiol-dependent enzyme n=1 Tax=Streptantibioticus ferralitis TaxID=236510 RepID=A0ABT5YW46_9ACTN|nr:maleylpyruvate isomerase family mycothiol-dependent enzyme [Streptantibioticus ferralitis]MDF2255669.1 maleylpyruvate isomerase family mycothiol-dependent enzyme [Streptantibioticus ferralitis]